MKPTLFLLLVLSVSLSNSQSVFRSSFSLENDGTAAQADPPPSNSVSHLNIEEGTVWIGTSKGLAKSINGGRSWISYRENDAFAKDGIFAIATRGNVVWASTGFTKDTPSGDVQTGAGYAFSTNAGSSWTHVPQSVDARGDSIFSYGINDSLWLLPVTVPEQNVTFDLALSSGTVWIASWASGLRKSTDNGTHWQRILLPTDGRNSLSPDDSLWQLAPGGKKIYPRLDPRNNNNFLAFSVFASDDTTIWCGTAGGINKSTDGGLSWLKFNHQNQRSGILGNWVIAIDEQRFGGVGRIWTTNWKAEDQDEEFGVSYTDDGGRTWTNLLHGIRAYDFAFRDSIVYIATEQGIFRSADGGETFEQFETFLDSEQHQYLPSPNVYSVETLGDTVFMGTSGGVVMTMDNENQPFGSSWKIQRRFDVVGSRAITYAYPNPFSPSIERVRLHYNAGGAAGTTRKVKIDIFDFGMNRIRTLINDASRIAGQEYDELWDGRTDEHQTAANGVYFYRVTVDDEEPMHGKILLLQ